MDKVSRRDFIRTGIGAAALGMVGFDAGVSFAEPTMTPAAQKAIRKRALRIAHLTDVHIQPEREAAKGFAACLHHVQSLKDRPDLILNGGDAIMDAFAVGRDRTKQQWDLWHNVIRTDCSLPVESCIGNHDVWGWNKTKSECTGAEDRYGKKWALEAMKLPERYRSFDRAGWHFIVLDSVFPSGEGYVGKLDEPQYEWLVDNLKKTPSDTPILILSHIPILSACVFYDGELENKDGWSVPAAWMHTDTRRLKDLFFKHRNVRVCLSGHLHLVDRVDYNGVTYLCNGAVSGNWWKGTHQECEAGYAVVNLYTDGTFDREYIPYGWIAKV